MLHQAIHAFIQKYDAISYSTIGAVIQIYMMQYQDCILSAYQMSANRSSMKHCLSPRLRDIKVACSLDSNLDRSMETSLHLCSNNARVAGAASLHLFWSSDSRYFLRDWTQCIDHIFVHWNPLSHHHARASIHTCSFRRATKDRWICHQGSRSHSSSYRPPFFGILLVTKNSHNIMIWGTN
jgi:hypothetical protein